MLQYRNIVLFTIIYHVNFHSQLSVWKYLLSLPLHINLLIEFSDSTLGTCSNIQIVLLIKIILYTTLSSLAGTHIQNNNTTQSTILSLTNTTLVTVDLIPLCKKMSVPKWWLAFLQPQKNGKSSTSSMAALLHLTCCTPTIPNLYFTNFLTVFNEHGL